MNGAATTNNASADRPLIWAVDDSPLHLGLVRRVLSNAYDIVTFDDGASALEALASGAPMPEVLITDWHMPIVSGLELCKSVRERFDETALPVLILTASGDRDDLLTGLAAGANDYVAKPFEPLELFARVNGLARFKRLGDALRGEAHLRERFMGILGHDLRQPLNSLALGADLLRRANLPAREARTAHRLAEVAGRMARMVTDLLDMTQSRLGDGIPLKRGETDFADVCTRVVDEARQAHPEVVVELHASGPTTGYWDADRLGQVCGNLLGNALAHGREGGAIAVTLQGRASEVELSVENGGESISESLRSKLFEPFRRGSSTRSTGLGLGLFIVDQIARAHGGSVGVTSEGGTTRFTVRLPRGEEPERAGVVDPTSNGGRDVKAHTE
jgi:signal transduction histidine kinase